jgi:hypothetical protein
VEDVVFLCRGEWRREGGDAGDRTGRGKRYLLHSLRAHHDHDHGSHSTSHLPPLQLLEKAASEFLGVHAQILEQVLEDFKALEQHHKDTPAEQFNNDAVYKNLTAKGIETKTMALNKARVCAGQASRRDDLARFLARPLADFATRAVELEVKTGLANSVFPWEELLQCYGTVNFGRWKAKGVEPGALRVVGDELAKNANLRAVTLEAENGKIVALALPEGWQTKKLEWGNNTAVQLNQELACLLVAQCVELEKLEIR